MSATIILPTLKFLKVVQSDSEFTIQGFQDIDKDDADVLKTLWSSPPPPEIAPSPLSVPYPFDANKILRAVFSQARDKEGKTITWHQAPLEIATDIFRKMLSDVPYDKFFSERPTSI